MTGFLGELLFVICGGIISLKVSDSQVLVVTTEKMVGPPHISGVYVVYEVVVDCVMRT
jgi:hypothetical protein